MTKQAIRFCWICSKQLRGNHSKVLTIDFYPRTLHKDCAKEVERQFDYIKREDGYHSVQWTLSGSLRD